MISMIVITLVRLTGGVVCDMQPLACQRIKQAFSGKHGAKIILNSLHSEDSLAHPNHTAYCTTIGGFALPCRAIIWPKSGDGSGGAVPARRARTHNNAKQRQTASETGEHLCARPHVPHIKTFNPITTIITTAMNLIFLP